MRSMGLTASRLAMALLVASLIEVSPVGAGVALAASAKGRPASTSKTCKFKLSTGKVQTWTCDKGQPCCASEQFGLYTCGSQLLQCL